MMLLFFNLEKDLKKLKAEKGIVDEDSENLVAVLDSDVKELND